MSSISHCLSENITTYADYVSSDRQHRPLKCRSLLSFSSLRLKAAVRPHSLHHRQSAQHLWQHLCPCQQTSPCLLKCLYLLQLLLSITVSLNKHLPLHPRMAGALLQSHRSRLVNQVLLEFLEIVALNGTAIHDLRQEKVEIVEVSVLKRKGTVKDVSVAHRPSVKEVRHIAKPARMAGQLATMSARPRAVSSKHKAVRRLRDSKKPAG